MDELGAVRADWQRLALRSGNVFSTWEWADAWIRRLGGDGRPLLGVCRRPDGEVAAILPLYVAGRRPVRTLRFIGHGPADELGPVCDPADRPAAIAALARLLSTRPYRSSVFVADRLPGSGWSGSLGGSVLRRESSPVLVTGGRSFEAFLASRSRNFRGQVRRRARRLERERDAQYRVCREPASLETDFGILVDLHERRWGGVSRAFGGGRLAFHRDFAATALDRGWLRLWRLELDGVAAAAWYGLRFAGTDSYYQAGRDPDEDRSSAGFVLLARTIEAAFDDGMREYRFLLGGEEYKSRFASEVRELETVAVPHDLTGRAATVAARAARRLPAPWRRRAAALAG